MFGVVPSAALEHNRNRFGPRVERIVGGMLNYVPPPALTVIDDRRPALLRVEAGAAEHAVTRGRRRQHGLVPLPVDHVVARHVSEHESPGIAVDVVQMHPALVVEDAVGVARHRHSGTRMCQVERHPGGRRLVWPRRRIGHVWPGGHGRGNTLRRLLRTGLRPCRDQVSRPVEDKASALDLCPAHEGIISEVAGPVLDHLALEIPPRQGLDVRGLVGPQRLDLPKRQCPVVDPRVVDRPGQHRPRSGPDVPQSKHRDVVFDTE